jgi:methylglyoxal synthase
VANDLATPTGRRIALIAHDNKKRDMLEWAEYNLDLLTTHELFATATTGRLLRDHLGLPITCFRSGPFGGDQQIGPHRNRATADFVISSHLMSRIHQQWDPMPKRDLHDQEPETTAQTV